MRFVPAQQPAFRAFAGSVPPRFVNEVELECAKMFDYYGIRWEYEPTTFVLERDDEGRVTSAFTPDLSAHGHRARYLDDRRRRSGRSA